MRRFRSRTSMVIPLAIAGLLSPTPSEAQQAPPAAGPAEPARDNGGGRDKGDKPTKSNEPDERATDVVVSAAPGRGLTVRRRDDLLALTVRGRIQVRDTVKIEPDETTNEINIKTVRLFFQGHVLSPDIKYSLQLALGGNDFEPGSSSPLFDAWVDYTGIRDLQIRVGQFFVPFDRARTIREFALQLVDRPLVVSELTLDRDVGLMLSSNDLFGTKVLGYHLGIFGGEGRNRFGGEETGFLYVGRVVLRPFGAFDDDQEGDIARLPKPRLAVAIAGAYNQATNRPRSTTGTAYKAGRFDYKHAAADLVFKYAGLSLLGEVLYRRGTPDAITGEVEGKEVTEWSRSGFGYLAQVGVMLTKQVEIAGRWDQLIAADKTDPALIKQAEEQGYEIGGGLNWYLNGHLFKVQADYAYQFGSGVTGGRQLARLQLDASF